MIRFDEQVVLVTGAAGGLGRAYAEAIGSRGATVIVHDAGVNRDGSGSDPAAAEAVTDGEFQVQRYPASARAPLPSGVETADGLLVLLADASESQQADT